MASSIRSWIQNTIIEHDRQHGADLSVRRRSPVLCQLVQFTTVRTTVRTPTQPGTQVTAIVSDKSHKVAVAFDSSATDSFERSKAGEDPERITGALRSVLRLNEYSLSIVAPSRRLFAHATAAELPHVRLLVHQWDVVTGDRNDPEYFPRTKDVGRGRGPEDEAVRLVLRKFWLGDSQNAHASPTAKPIAYETSRSASLLEHELPPIDRRALKTARQLVLNTTRQGKPLPGWLFTAPSAAQRVALDQIGVFGVDIHGELQADVLNPEPDVASFAETNGHSNESQRTNGHSNESQLSNGHSNESRLSKGSGHLKHGSPEHESLRAQAPSLPPMSPVRRVDRSELSLMDLGSSERQRGARRSQSPELYSAAHSHPRRSQTPEHYAAEAPPENSLQPLALTQAPIARFHTPADSSDDEDEIPVRPTVRPTHRQRIFASSPAAPRASSQPTGETDDEDLSDYERQQRRVPAEAEVLAYEEYISDAERAQRRTQATQAPPLVAEMIAPTGESLSKSQDSGSFNLTRFVQSVPAAPSSPAAPAGQVSSSAPAVSNYVLVPTTTDESVPAEREVDDSPPEPPAPTPVVGGPVPPRKRPRASDVTTASGEADDEASLQQRKRRRPTQATATATASADAVEHEEEEYTEDKVYVDAQDKAESKPDLTTPATRSLWEPPPGQRTPPTAARPATRALLVAEAARLVLPGYRPDLCAFPVAGLTRAWVEAARDKAIEGKEARERARREPRASASRRTLGT